MRQFPRRPDIALTWLNVSFGAGAFSTPLLAGFVLTRFGNYTPLYLAGAAVLAVPIVPVCVSLPQAEARDGPAKLDLPAALGLLRDRNLRLLMAIAALFLGAEIGFGGWIISIVSVMAHISPARLAPLASAFWICLALGGAPTVVLLRLGLRPRQLIVLGALTASAAALLLALGGASVALAIACCAALGFAISPILPMVTSLATRRGGADGVVGPRVAAIFTAGQLGGATLPAVQGLLVTVSPVMALGLTALAALAMAALGGAIVTDTPAT